MAPEVIAAVTPDDSVVLVGGLAIAACCPECVALAVPDAPEVAEPGREVVLKATT